MCLALYSAAEAPLPVVPWRPEAPAFHVIELPPALDVVRRQFALPCVYYMGSHERCGCPFNYGREHPEHEVDPLQLTAAKQCVTQLSSYVRENEVLEIYSCQFDEEEKPRLQQRVVTPEQFGADTFVFLEGELPEVGHGASLPQGGHSLRKLAGARDPGWTEPEAKGRPSPIGAQNEMVARE